LILGTLHEYEQARDHTKALLIKYLVDYMFKDWVVTETRKIPVTRQMKIDKATEIAEHLGGTEWFSHGRPIDLKKLTELGIRLHDYSENIEFTRLLLDYYYPIISFISDREDTFIHTRRFA